VPFGATTTARLAVAGELRLGGGATDDAVMLGGGAPASTNGPDVTGAVGTKTEEAGAGGRTAPNGEGATIPAPAGWDEAVLTNAMCR
jgi:hypothetical protein